MSVQGERLVRMEVEVTALKDSLEEHKQETNRRFDEISRRQDEANSKLDDLLALRNKGAGVFWLIATLVGTGIVGGAWQVLSYLFGRSN